MANWTDQYDSVFFISLATLLIGAFGVSVKYCMRSKCEDLNLCFGLVHVKRNVELEARIEEKQIELGITDEESKI
jgi:hypothetical protein